MSPTDMLGQATVVCVVLVSSSLSLISFSGRMPMAELADAVVQYGRSTLEWSASIIRTHCPWKAEVVYGDTDSLFVHLRGRSREAAHDIGDEIAERITSLTPLDIVLKMEKVYLPCVLASKKRYVGYSFESKSLTEPHFDAKGIEVARRDQCPCTVKIQEKALRILFSTKDLSEVKKYLCDQWGRIHEGGNRIPLRDFIFRREVKLGHYAKDPMTGEPKMLPPAALMACQQMIKDPRQEPPYGWRVPYVVCDSLSTQPPVALLLTADRSLQELLTHFSKI
jgi:DNA polymerase zeta